MTENFVEWILIDSDLTTPLALLPAVDGKLYLERNEPGSGSLRVHSLQSSAAALLDYGQLVLCRYRGEIRGGFFIESINEVTVSSGESSDLFTEISGRGMLALLDDAILWNIGTAATIVTPPATKGALWVAGITLAQARGCLSMLTRDFNGVTDSASEAWTDTESMEFTIGKSYLEIMRTFVEMGVHFSIDINYDPYIAGAITDGTPIGLLLSLTYTSNTGGDPEPITFTLHAYKNIQGSDLSETIHFRRGVNVLDAGSQTEGADLRNALDIKYGYGDDVGYTSLEDATSISTYRRREKYLDATDANTSASALSYAAGKLDRMKDPQYELSIRVTDASLAARVFEDYNINDIVTYDASGTETVTDRISSLQLEWAGDDQNAQVTVGFGNPIYDEQLKQARDIKDLQEMTPRIGNAEGTGGGATYTWVVRLPAVGGIPGPLLSQALTASQIDAYTEAGTSVEFNIELRSTIASAGSDLMTADMVADSDGETDAALAVTSLTADNWLYLDIAAVTGDVEMFVVTLRTA